MSKIYDQSLEMHEKNKGKLEINSKIPLLNKEDLSLAYTPGVAGVCEEIAKNPKRARDYTIKSNTVAVVTDGSSILGLGNLGALASIPVMEGKAAIFKEFGGVNAFPICLDTQDTEEIIKTIKNIAPIFGGINLEDISAPRCFEIEERLRKELDIPVMHDDQWGAATVTLAALINSLKLRNSDFKNVKIVLSGVGAAGVATGRLLHSYGIKNTIFCDSNGIINENRKDLNKEKKELLEGSNSKNLEGKLVDAIVEADVFIGLSKPNVLTEEMVKTMAKNPIIFALANPNPEITPESAHNAGVYIVATGRSDYPNQINNSLVFPGAFKAMLDLRIPQFDNKFFIKIAESLANAVKDLSKDNIIPSMFDKDAHKAVYQAIASFKE
jgi:malate dehydrogenase (oxaloacetate-decarboxylating)